MLIRINRVRSILLVIFLFICSILYSRCSRFSSENPKIAVACMSTHEESYGYKSLSNKLLYVKKHGYHLEFDFSGDGFWHKINIVHRLVQQKKYDWIWWIDFDTLITNTTIRLEDLIEESLATVPDPNKIDMILNRDCVIFNAGSMLFRSNSRVSAFLTRVLTCRHDGFEGKKKPNEQDCFDHLLKENKHDENEHMLFIPQWKMNAYPEEIPCYDKTKRKWEPGMFVIHFPGAWMHMPNVTDAKGELFRRYHWRIIH